jgi:RES domain-containing protein
MKVFRISKCAFINDLTGQGAARYGGRWNSKGTYILYAASSASLALLENLVHIPTIIPDGFCMLCLEIPDDLTLVYEKSRLPENWQEYPAPSALKIIGDLFVQNNKYLCLKIPSSILHEDDILLINPNHHLFNKVKINYSRVIDLDKRLLKLK